MSTGNISEPHSELPQVTQSNPSVNVSVPVPRANQGQGDLSPSIVDIARVFSDHANLSRLPIPEPSIFMGDPLKYPDWKVTFEMLIVQRGIPPIERVHYLKKYIGGVAKEAVEGYFTMWPNSQNCQVALYLWSA